MATFANILGITSIELEKTVHCYCPMGKAWYTGIVVMSIEPGAKIMDYLDVDAFFEDEIESKELIIESVVSKVACMLENYDPKRYSVTVSVKDAAHLPVTVTKRSE